MNPARIGRIVAASLLAGALFAQAPVESPAEWSSRFKQLAYRQWNGRDQEGRGVLARFGTMVVNEQKGLYLTVEPDWEHKREVIIMPRGADPDQAVLWRVWSRDEVIFPRKWSAGEKNVGKRRDITATMGEQWEFKVAEMPDLSDPAPQPLCLPFAFDSPDRITQTWTWWRDGHQVMETFKFQGGEF